MLHTANRFRADLLAKKHRASRRREGKAALTLLLMLPVLLFAVGVALFASEMVEFRTQMQNTADASALAGVQVLVDDRVLLGGKDDMLDLVRIACREVDRYARVNPVLGAPVVLAPNPQNRPDGDVVFGILDRFRAPTFVVANLADESGAFLNVINTVRIHIRRTRARGNPGFLHGAPLLGRQPTDLEAVATAMLDRDVIGFRPTRDGIVPLAPIALFSDPQGEDENSWEFNVEKRGGSDRWRFNRGNRQPESGADGLHEMKVTLSRQQQSQQSQGSTANSGQSSTQSTGSGSGQVRRPSACLLQLGTDGPEALAVQLVNGVTREHLQAFGGELVLGPNNRLIVPGTPYLSGIGDFASGQLRAALQQLAREATPRIWPLYQEIDGRTAMPVLTGFVAARVMEVRTGEDGEEGTGVSFVVQPCMMSVPAAVTDALRRGIGGIPVINRYICKVRLVE